MGLFAPAGTSAELLRQAQQAAMVAISTQGFASTVGRGSQPRALSSAEFDKYIANQRKEFEAIVSKHGINK